MVRVSPRLGATRHAPLGEHEKVSTAPPRGSSDLDRIGEPTRFSTSPPPPSASRPYAGMIEAASYTAGGQMLFTPN